MIVGRSRETTLRGGSQVHPHEVEHRLPRAHTTADCTIPDPARFLDAFPTRGTGKVRRELERMNARETTATTGT